MANMSIGTNPIVVIPQNIKRHTVRFQNTGNTDVYLSRYPNTPSSSNYDVLLSHTGGDPNESNFTTESVAQYSAVSSGVKGELAIFETSYVS